MPSALIYGSTGAVGSKLMRALLETKDFTQITEAGRRSLTPDACPPSVTFHQVDFENVEKDTKLAEVKPEVVFITLGTTRATAGGAEAFKRIDKEYVLNGAKAVRSASVTKQRVLYCSVSVVECGVMSFSISPRLQSRGSSPTSPFLCGLSLACPALLLRFNTMLQTPPPRA